MRCPRNAFCRGVLQFSFLQKNGHSALKPKLPPVVAKPTNALCTLALDVSKKVKRVKGKLDGYNIIGYLVADHLGLELLDWQEALKVGQQYVTQMDAVSHLKQQLNRAKDAATQAESLAATRKSECDAMGETLRAAQAADKEREASLQAAQAEIA